MITVIWTKKTKNALTTYGPPEPLGEGLKSKYSHIFYKTTGSIVWLGHYNRNSSNWWQQKSSGKARKNESRCGV